MACAQTAHPHPPTLSKNSVKGPDLRLLLREGGYYTQAIKNVNLGGFIDR